MSISTGESLQAVVAEQPVEPAAAAADNTPAKSRCGNCDTELLGPHCHVCGQPVHGMIRPLSNMLSDVADTIFNIDSRIFRTLVPLYFRPGLLTNEYFAGHRVRYVTPFRLYFFLSIAAFFAIQYTVGDMNMIQFDVDSGSNNISSALTPQEVITRRDAKLATLSAVKKIPGMPGVADMGMDKAAAAIRDEADKRLAYLKGVETAKANGEDPFDSTAGKNKLVLGSTPWDMQKNPIRIGWLPDIANAKLNAMAQRMQENMSRIRKDPKPFLAGAFGALSPVLFLLMPLFALLLKIFYIFKRRLYMEHLIVALHSHSFLFLSMLMLTLVVLIRDWADTSAPLLSAPLGWVIFAMSWWLPIYLLIMQKRVYRQGWFLTIIKYCVIGICYTVMISIGIATAFVVSLATT